MLFTQSGDTARIDIPHVFGARSTGAYTARDRNPPPPPSNGSFNMDGYSRISATARDSSQERPDFLTRLATDVERKAHYGRRAGLKKAIWEERPMHRKVPAQRQRSRQTDS